MSERQVASLMKAQLERQTNLVADMARRLGVSYALWPNVREAMEKCRIDSIDLADCLASSGVVEILNFMGVTRLCVTPADPTERISSATVIVHQDSETIEVVALKVKEKSR